MIRLGIFAYIQQTYARYWGTNLTIYGWGQESIDTDGHR